jgi:hypothetical protein
MKACCEREGFTPDFTTFNLNPDLNPKLKSYIEVKDKKRK